MFPAEAGRGQKRGALTPTGAFNIGSANPRARAGHLAVALRRAAADGRALQPPVKALALLMRVLIVDDHPLMREAVCALLADLRPGAEQLTAGSVADALRVLDTGPVPDVAVLDLCLADGDSEPVVRRLRVEGGLGPRIFVLSASSDAADARRMLRAGANGYCPKSDSPQTLAAALRMVLDGHRYVPSLLLDAGEDPSRPASSGRLTQRQREVLELLARGLPNKTIGRELGIAERTVKVHVQGLFELLGATNRTHVVARARQAGLLGSTAAAQA